VLLFFAERWKQINLRQRDYDWKFIPIAGGQFTDSGSGSCHGPVAKEASK
jgi:hypothetical protein